MQFLYDNYCTTYRTHWLGYHPKIMIMKFRMCKNVSEPSYKTFCNVLCIWACPGHPYL